MMDTNIAKERQLLEHWGASRGSHISVVAAMLSGQWLEAFGARCHAKLSEI